MKDVLEVQRGQTKKHRHIIELHPKKEGTRVYRLLAKNKTEQDEWIEALKSFLVSLSKSEPLLCVVDNQRFSKYMVGNGA